MPVIISMVPDSVTKEISDQVREDIRMVLKKKGIPREYVTVEFIRCAFPEKLVVEYKIRSANLKHWELGRADREAEIVRKVIERHFKMFVESIVVVLDKKITGISLTPTEKEESGFTDDGLNFIQGVESGSRDPDK